MTENYISSFTLQEGKGKLKKRDVKFFVILFTRERERVGLLTYYICIFLDY